MRSRAEEMASRCLRAILAPLPYGAVIHDSDDFSLFQRALEYVLPSALREVYPWWQHESLDAFRFAVARKIGIEEAEFIGLCLLISDQTWTPIYLRMSIARESDSFDWLECRVGELGDDAGGMLRIPHKSARINELPGSVEQRLESIQWAYTISRDTQRGTDETK